jgi:hypothetical protein
VVLISGRAGIGKTRPAAIARWRTMTVQPLFGAATGNGGPFQPFVEAMPAMPRANG